MAEYHWFLFCFWDYHLFYSRRNFYKLTAKKCFVFYSKHRPAQIMLGGCQFIGTNGNWIMPSLFVKLDTPPRGYSPLLAIFLFTQAKDCLHRALPQCIPLKFHFAHLLLLFPLPSHRCSVDYPFCCMAMPEYMTKNTMWFLQG